MLRSFVANAVKNLIGKKRKNNMKKIYAFLILVLIAAALAALNNVPMQILNYEMGDFILVVIAYLMIHELLNSYFCSKVAVFLTYFLATPVIVSLLNMIPVSFLGCDLGTAVMKIIAYATIYEYFYAKLENEMGW